MRSRFRNLARRLRLEKEEIKEKVIDLINLFRIHPEIDKFERKEVFMEEFVEGYRSLRREVPEVYDNEFIKYVSKYLGKYD